MKNINIQNEYSVDENWKEIQTELGTIVKNHLTNKRVKKKP
jgi:hypothetical protein